jgi:hypothetical protein
MSKRLFELSPEILQLEAELESDELSEEQRAEKIAAWLEAQDNAAQKLDNFAAWITSCDAMAEERRAQAARMTALARADENRAQRGRECLKLYFKTHQLATFKAPRFTIGLQASGGSLPVILDVEPEQLSAQFIEQVITYKVKTDELRSALIKVEAERSALLKAFEEKVISAEELDQALAKIQPIVGAHLGERGKSIRIR